MAKTAETRKVLQLRCSNLLDR